MIISSDFARARQSADIAQRALVTATPVRPHKSLRERFFGDFDMQGAEHYPKVWERDAHDPGHTEWQVESVLSVATRTRKLISALERCYCDTDCLLVAHGDVLQILQSLFNDKPLSRHRELTHLENAEIRRLDAKHI